MRKLFYLLIAFPSLGQTDIQGEVISKVPFGEVNYYFVKENGTENYYKTAATSLSSLNYGQTIKLNLTPRLDNFIEVSDPVTNVVVLAKKVIPNGNNGNTSNQISQDLLLRLPIPKRNILFFSSKKHFDEVYNLVEAYVDNVKATNGSEFGLNQVEGTLQNYTSFRKHYNTTYDSDKNHYSFTDVDKVEKKDFIIDEILKILLNKDRLVGIGDMIYYYHSGELIVSFNIKTVEKIEDFNEKINYIHQINIENEDLNNDFPIIPYPLYTDKNNIFIGDVIVSNTKDYYQLNSVSPAYRSTLIKDAIQCQPYRKKIHIYTERQEWIPESINPTTGVITPGSFGAADTYVLPAGSQLKINWGDGTPIEIVNNYVGGHRTHTYTSFNNFDVTTTLIMGTQEGQEATLNDAITIPVNDLVCSTGDAEQPGAVASGNSNGDWKMTTMIFVKHNIFAQEVGAYTHGWKKVSGDWKRKFSNIEVSIDGTFRNENCGIVENKTESDSENQERVDAEKFKINKNYRAHTNFDVKSTHKLVKGGVTLTLNMTLIVCP